MLTQAQRATLKTDIQARAALNAAVALADWPAVAIFYNSPSSPVVTVWRPDVTPSQINSVVGMSEFVALTAVKQNGLLLQTQAAFIDATSATVRAAFGQIFSAGATLTALTALAIRTGTYLETLLAGAATGGSVVSAVYGYQVQADEIRQAMAGQ